MKQITVVLVLVIIYAKFSNSDESSFVLIKPDQWGYAKKKFDLESIPYSQKSNRNRPSAIEEGVKSGKRPHTEWFTEIILKKKKKRNRSKRTTVATTTAGDKPDDLSLQAKRFWEIFKKLQKQNYDVRKKYWSTTSTRKHTCLHTTVPTSTTPRPVDKTSDFKRKGKRKQKIYLSLLSSFWGDIMKQKQEEIRSSKSTAPTSVTGSMTTRKKILANINKRNSIVDCISATTKVQKFAVKTPTNKVYFYKKPLRGMKADTTRLSGYTSKKNNSWIKYFYNDKAIRTRKPELRTVNVIDDLSFDTVFTITMGPQHKHKNKHADVPPDTDVESVSDSHESSIDSQEPMQVDSKTLESGLTDTDSESEP